jgi:peptide/nickel transport system permease protein
MVPGSPLDAGIALIATLGLSIPEFWLAMLLIIVFAVHLHVVPASGFVPFSTSPGGWFWHILLPAFTIGFVQSAAISRIIRSSVLDTLGQAYIQTARGKGLGEGTVLVKHALRSALLPVLTVVGIVLMLLIAGSFVVEIVFAIPGLGLLLLSSMLNHDYPMVQGGILFVGTVIMLTNLLVDVTYTLADPRVRYG